LVFKIKNKGSRALSDNYDRVFYLSLYRIQAKLRNCNTKEPPDPK
jgi:hypothetical protein